MGILPHHMRVEEGFRVPSSSLILWPIRRSRAIDPGPPLLARREVHTVGREGQGALPTVCAGCAQMWYLSGSCPVVHILPGSWVLPKGSAQGIPLSHL